MAATEVRTVKPDLASGTRDLLPVEALAQRTMVERIIGVYESFGFVPLETPCLEKWGVLTGDDPNFNKSIFRAVVVRGAEDRNIDVAELGSDDTALRFDLTVSLARVVALYSDLPRPFKRYQIGRVFRGEQAQAGRFREFTQLDFDIIGSNSILADVECIQIMYAVMRVLGIDSFIIRFNTRKVLNGLAEFVGCSDKARAMFRIVDKFEKIDLKGVMDGLRREPDNQWDDSALAMSQDQAQKVATFIGIRGGSFQETIRDLATFFGDANESARQGLKELQALVCLLTSLGIPECYWCIDLSVARGLDYYTGPVFETYLTTMPQLGSVLSGGRFDGLTNRFMAGSNIAGVGASVGIDRMMIGLKELGLLPEFKSVVSLLVTVFPGNDSLAGRSMQFAQAARARRIKTEVYLGEDSTLRAQFAYAAKQEIPYVVVIGPDEARAGKVQLRDMLSRSQRTLTQEEVFGSIT